MSTVAPTTKPEARSRREVLCGLMVALVAPGALVAACSDTTTPAPSGTGTGAGTPTPAGPLAAVTDVPQGSGLVVPSTSKGPILLIRPTPDTVKAFDASCPHQGTTVAPPVGGTITCPNHGSTFDGTTGALKGGPATRGLTEIPVKVEGDQVVFA